MFLLHQADIDILVAVRGTGNANTRIHMYISGVRWSSQNSKLVELTKSQRHHRVRQSPIRKISPLPSDCDRSCSFASSAAKMRSAIGLTAGAKHAFVRVEDNPPDEDGSESTSLAFLASGCALRAGGERGRFVPASTGPISVTSTFSASFALALGALPSAMCQGAPETSRETIIMPSVPAHRRRMGMRATQGPQTSAS